VKRINTGYPLYFENSEYRSTALDSFCSGMKPDEFCKSWHYPIACLRLGGGDLDTPREALKEALRHFIDTEFCPCREDKTHCECWFDGEPCCNCGSDEGCIGPDCKCGKPDCEMLPSRGHTEIKV